MRDLKIADRMAKKISALIAPDYVCISDNRVRIIPCCGFAHSEVSISEFVYLCRIPVEDLVKYLDDSNRLMRYIFEVRLGET